MFATILPDLIILAPEVTTDDGSARVTRYSDGSVEFRPRGRRGLTGRGP